MQSVSGSSELIASNDRNKSSELNAARDRNKSSEIGKITRAKRNVSVIDPEH